VLDDEDAHAPFVGETANECRQFGRFGVAEARRRFVEE
jgi:hypothetical protein